MSILQFTFENFESLSFETGEWVGASQSDGDGNEWELMLFPGGDNGEDGANGEWQDDGNGQENDECEDSTFASLCLVNVGELEKSISCSMIIKNANGLAVKEFKSYGNIVRDGWWCWKKAIKRSFVLDEENNVLADGAFIVEVDIQSRSDRNEYHVSPNPFGKNMLDLLESGDKADVSFKIGDTTFCAHKLIIGVNSPILASVSERADINSPVIITETSAEVFRLVLRYVYGGDTPGEEEVLSVGKEILNAADRFDVVGLKMEVEAQLVACRVVHVTNVADYLLFAHSKTCPLLKEYAISFFVSRAKYLLESDYLGNLDKSSDLMKEIMLAIVINSDKTTIDNGLDLKTMTVDTLRKRLSEKGLDIEGSKETLVSRLESSKKRPRDE